MPWHGWNTSPAELAAKIGHPDNLASMRIGGALESAYRRGYAGQPDNKGNPRNSRAALFYQAGRVAGGHRK